MGSSFSKNNNNVIQPQTHNISCYQKLCCKIGGFEVRVNSVLEALPLTFEQKRIIRKRLVKQVVNLEDDCKKVSFRYNLCRIIIGIGSMALPSLQGLQGQDNTKDWEVELFWSGIFISLCVMIANSMISMFQLDKNYILYNITNERLKSTMWKYFEQSGQFAGKSYNDNWVIFWNEIEKIKALQITSEYAESDNNDNSMSNKEVEEVVKKHEDENNKKKIIMEALKQQVLKQKMLLKSKVQEIELPQFTQDIVDEIQDVSKVNIIIDEDNEEVLYFDEQSEQEKELIQKNKEDKKKIKDNKIISEDKTTI